MPWKHVYEPVKGMITARSATGIPSEASPLIRNMYIRDGEVCSDTGITEFPVAGDLKTNSLLGGVMKFAKLMMTSGVNYLLAFTTRYLYQYNDTTHTWDVLMRGTLLEDCEDAWTEVFYTGSYTPILYEPNNVLQLPTWTKYYGTVATVAREIDASCTTGYRLNIDSSAATERLYYSYEDLNLSNSVGYQIEAKFKVIDGGTSASQSIQIGDGTYYFYVHFTTSAVTLLSNYIVEATQTYSMDTTDDYHIYLINVSGTAITITIDGTLRISGTLDASSSSKIITWGAIVNGTNWWGQVYWDYIKYKVGTFVTDVSAVVKLRGSNSIKIDLIDLGYTGILAYETISSTDISASTNTHLSFWIYSDTSLASDVLRMRISEQTAGGTGATYADYTIPALTANEWQHVSVAIASPVAASAGTFPDDLNAVLSVALVANSNPGSCTIYLDDIRTAQEFTGDEDNRFSTTTLQDSLICTNGIDLPFKIYDSGGLTVAPLTLTLPSGAITTSEVVIAFKDHILYMNNTENGADCPQRVSWTNIGSLTDHINGTCGFQDLIDDPGWIIAAALLSDDVLVIYKEHSIVQCRWTGGQTPFTFETIVTGPSIIGKDALCSGISVHAFITNENIYSFAGVTSEGVVQLKAIGEMIKNVLFDEINESYFNRTFLMHSEMANEYQIWIPTATETPDKAYVYQYKDDTWVTREKSITAAGVYQAQSSITIGDLVGPISAQNWTFGSKLVKDNTQTIIAGDADGKIYYFNELTLNDNGVAISKEFQTPDFVLPDTPEYMNQFMRTTQFSFEACGQEVTVEWSDDSGVSWYPTQGNGTNTVALTSNYVQYQQDFMACSKKIRFRLTNAKESSGFRLRYYGVQWTPRTGRR